MKYNKAIQEWQDLILKALKEKSQTTKKLQKTLGINQLWLPCKKVKTAPYAVQALYQLYTEGLIKTDDRPDEKKYGKWYLTAAGKSSRLFTHSYSAEITAQDSSSDELSLDKFVRNLMADLQKLFDHKREQLKKEVSENYDKAISESIYYKKLSEQYKDELDTREAKSILKF